MKEAFVKRTWSILQPDDELSEEAIRQIRPGQVVRNSWTRPRKIRFHRKIIALLKSVFELQDFFDDFDVFRFWIIMKAGYFDVIATPKGKVIFKPKSISFASMDEDEFEKLYSKILDVSIKQFGITKENIEKIMEFI